MVTQTAEWLGLRPVANAFGTSVSAIATVGLGMSASAQSRSIIPCSSGASSGVTTRARIAASAILSEKYHWPSPKAAGQEQHEPAAEVGEVGQRHEHRDVQTAEQQHHRAHARCQTSVTAKSRACHDSSSLTSSSSAVSDVRTRST